MSLPFIPKSAIEALIPSTPAVTTAYSTQKSRVETALPSNVTPTSPAVTSQTYQTLKSVVEQGVLKAGQTIVTTGIVTAAQGATTGYVYVPRVTPPVTLTVTGVPAKVPEWTHKLVLGFVRTPWAVESIASAAVSSILIPLVNPFITKLGYDYVRYELDWAASTVTVYYRQRGSPAIGAGAILAAVVICTVMAGLVWINCNWLEGEKIAQQEKTDLGTLLKEGKISEDTYKDLMKGTGAAAAVTGLESLTNLIPLVIFGGIAVAALGIVPRRRD